MAKESTKLPDGRILLKNCKIEVEGEILEGFDMVLIPSWEENLS